MLGVYKVPKDLMSNENKWLKYFTTRQCMIIAFTLFIDYFLYKITAFFSLSAVGIVLGFILLAIVFFMLLVKVSDKQYLFGAGLYLETVLIRIILRKSKKVIYIKNYKK